MRDPEQVVDDSLLSAGLTFAHTSGLGAENGIGSNSWWGRVEPTLWAWVSVVSSLRAFSQQ
jgi:hypothetical protein